MHAHMIHDRESGKSQFGGRPRRVTCSTRTSLMSCSFGFVVLSGMKLSAAATVIAVRMTGMSTIRVTTSIPSTQVGTSSGSATLHDRDAALPTGVALPTGSVQGSAASAVMYLEVDGTAMEHLDVSASTALTTEMACLTKFRK